MAILDGVGRSSSLFRALLLAIYLAFLYALAASLEPSSLPLVFGAAALFSAWVVLATIMLLRLLSPWLQQHSNTIQSLTVVLVAAFLGAAFGQIVDYLSLPGFARDAVIWTPVRFSLLAGLLAILMMLELHARSLLLGQVKADSQARLRALQARIRPHFLFNALNTISSLIHDRPDQAEAATLDLADLLRTGITEDSEHTVEAELTVIARYLRIESLRLGDRLKAQWDCSEVQNSHQAMPTLLLQPLVENAIVHGISRRTEGGTLRIEGRRIRFGRIRFTVTNPLADPDSRPTNGNNSALDNIRQRLALAYEERYGLKTRIEDGYFIAELTIPVDS